MPTTNHCLQCNYPLTGLLTPRCPECGNPFDPNNPATQNTTGRPARHWRKHFLRLPAWPLLPAAACTFLAQLWLERVPLTPRFPNDGTKPIALAWLAIAIPWLFFLTLVAYVARTSPIAWRPPRRRWLWSLPALFLLSLLAGTLNWGFHACFLLSRIQLTAFATSALARYPSIDFPATTLGLYHASEIYATNNLALVRIGPDNWFVYSPDGPPPPWTGRLVQALPSPHWYLVQPSEAFGHFYDRRTYMADHISKSLFSNPDPRPATITMLIKELARDRPEILFYNTGALPANPSESLNVSADLRPEVQALTRLGPAAVRFLSTALAANAAHPDEYLGTLGLIGPAAVPASAQIAALLTHPDPHARALAAWALGRLGPAALPQLPSLLPALDDPNFNVVTSAQRAIDAINPPMPDSADALSPHWNRLVEFLTRVGPAAAPLAPQITASMQHHMDYLGQHSEIPDGITYRRYLSDVGLGARILAAIGPIAGASTPAVTAMLQQSIQKNVGFYHDENGLDRLLTQTLVSISPRDPALIQLLLGLLQDARQRALSGPPDDIDANARATGGSELAFLLQSVDPANADVRLQLLADLHSPVDSPQRKWALTIARDLPLPADDLLPPLEQMITSGNADTCLCALSFAPVIGPKSAQLLPAAIRRIDAIPPDPRLFLRSGQTSSALALLPRLAPDSGDVADFLLRWYRLGRVFPATDAMGNLKAQAPRVIPTLLTSLTADASASLRVLEILAPDAADTAPLIVDCFRSTADPALKAKLLPVLAPLGPAARDAVPILLPRLFATPKGDIAHRALLNTLVQIGWTPEIEQAFAHALDNADDRDWAAESIPLFGAPALPLMLKKSSEVQDIGWLFILDIEKLSATTPVPLSTFDAKGYSPSPRAILLATGPTPQKIQHLMKILDRPNSPAAAIEAAAALVTLNATTPDAKNALLRRAYASPFEAVRTACFTALDTLFPAAR